MGAFGLGGFEMRGRPLSQLGYQMVDLRCRKPVPECDIGILVKYPLDREQEIRRACRFLIYDPLDCWSRLGVVNRNPIHYWREVFNRVASDVVIATSFPCRAFMGGTGRSQVLVIPHHHDPRVQSGWYNPRGPIVYCGDSRYIGNSLPKLRRAAVAVGRELEIYGGPNAWMGLQGAALNLNCRLPPYNTRLDKYCKPAIKCANANKADVPSVTLWDEITESYLTRVFNAALRTEQINCQPLFSERDYINAISALVTSYCGRCPSDSPHVQNSYGVAEG